MASDETAGAPSSDVPPFIKRGMRGPGQAAMDVLSGTWNVAIEIYSAGNSREHPATGKLTSTRSLIGGDRFLREETQGELADGSKYWRVGTLGYSNIDEAYEWITQDGINANMMFYRSENGTGPGFPLSMSGFFTDPGLLSEESVGVRVAQKTRIEIVDQNKHLIDLFFQAPEEEERFAVHMVYTRDLHERDGLTK